ncbi:MAG: hypothetical protein RL708_212 [Bacteroidota bacterium]|jgi:mRNA interferase HigB
MRIYSYKTLKEFWKKYPEARMHLSAWYDEIETAKFQTPNEVRKMYPSADVVGNGRIVFNIYHNKYRLVAVFRYQIQCVYIRFIGTHKEYDNINDIQNI